MIIFTSAEALQTHLSKQRIVGLKVGFAPTMGALHKGHLSLVAASKTQNDITVSSIFVNPTQFNNATDFAKYPITIEQDVEMLEGAGCDILFLPSVAEVYPNGTAPTRYYHLGYLETVLEGPKRPGHFQGVCQVVHRLLNLVQPQHLYLGQKDYQQCMVLSRLVQLLELPVKVVICPTLREADGLAMSSRNKRLDAAGRVAAAKLSQALLQVKSTLTNGPTDALLQQTADWLTGEGFVMEYLSLAQADTLQPITNWDGTTPLVALVAAFWGEIRLIDNMLLA